MTIEKALAAAANAFLALPEDKKSDTAKLDAEVLLLACIDQTRTYLYTWPEKQLSHKQHKYIYFISRSLYRMVTIFVSSPSLFDTQSSFGHLIFLTCGRVGSNLVYSFTISL